MKKKVVFGLATLMAIGGLSFADGESTCEKVVTRTTTVIGVVAGGVGGGSVGAVTGGIVGGIVGEKISDMVCNNDDKSYAPVPPPDYSTYGNDGWE